jgi:hypothetical protein
MLEMANVNLDNISFIIQKTTEAGCTPSHSNQNGDNGEAFKF